MAFSKLNTVAENQWARTGVKVDQITFEWTIENFKLFPQKVKEYISSPLFYTGHDNETWILKLYPRGDRIEATNFTSLFLVCESSDRLGPPGLNVPYKLSIVKSKKILVKKEATNTIYDSVNKAWGYSKFVDREKLLTADDADGTFTILCEMEIPCSNTVTSSYVVPKQREISLDARKKGLSGDFRSLFKEPKFSDFTIIVGDEKFKAHKSILTARSPVFAVMFDQHEMEENRKNEVKIENMEAAVVKGMLEFIYTNEVEDLELLATGLWGAGEKYDIEGLKAVCEGCLYKILNHDNAVEILVLADLYRAEELKKYVMRYIRGHLSVVVKTDGYKELQDLTLLKEFVCSLSSHDPQESKNKES